MSPPHEKDLKPSLAFEQENRQTDLDDFTKDELETLTTVKKKTEISTEELNTVKAQLDQAHPEEARREEVSAEEEIAAVKAQLGQAVEAHPEEVKPKPKKPRAKRLSAAKRKVIEAAVEERDDESKKPSAYVHPCIWKFPHRDLGKDETGKRVSAWEAGDDRLRLSIQADQITGHGVPYGTVTRLLLALSMRSALIYKDRELDLKRCQKAFLEELGCHNNGQYIRALKEQMRRLFFSTMTIELSTTPERKAYERINLFSSGEGGADYWKGIEGAKWPDSLVMSENFYQAAQETPVPIRLEVVQALGKSPLAVDTYLWLSYRMYRLRRSGKPFAKIPWGELQREFGAGYANTPQGKSEFKKKFKGAIKKVLVLYSQAANHVRAEAKHLHLTPAPIALNLRRPKASTRD